MPSTYAHYRFGQEVLKELPNDIKKIIIENKEEIIALTQQLMEIQKKRRN